MDTNGWDTVYVADVAVLNKSLATFSNSADQTMNTSFSGGSIDAKLGTWQIVPGGDGDYIDLEIAVTNGTLTMGKNPIKIDGICATSKVKLSLIPAPNGGQKLTFDLSSAGEQGSDASVTPVGIKLNGVTLSAMQQTVIGMQVAEALVKNAAEMAFVLAQIEPMAGAVSWLKPQKTAYAYGVEAGTNRQVMAIFAMCSDKPTKDLTTVIDPLLLAADTNFGLAISEEIFLERIFAPAFAKSVGTSVTNLETSNIGKLLHGLPGGNVLAKTMAKVFSAALGGTSGWILHTKKGFGLKSVKSGLITYHPKVKSASASISDNLIKTSLSGDCDMYVGVTMTFSSASQIETNFNGTTHAVNFAVKGKPTFKKSVDIPWYLHLADVVTWIAEIILQAVVAALGSSLSNGINAVTSNGDITKQAVSVVKWGGDTAFTPSRGGLATAFYVQGNV